MAGPEDRIPPPPDDSDPALRFARYAVEWDTFAFEGIDHLTLEEVAALVGSLAGRGLGGELETRTHRLGMSHSVLVDPGSPEWAEARAIAFRLISARIGAERDLHGLELALTNCWIRRSDNPEQAAVNLIDVLTTICWLIVTTLFDEEDVPDLEDVPEPRSPEDLLNLIDRFLERITTGGHEVD